MSKIFFLLALLTIIGTAAYAQTQEQAPPFAVAQFDKDQLLNRLATLKSFQSEKGGAGLGYAFPVTKEEFGNSLLFLAPEKVNEVMKDFGMAMGFLFKDNTQFLTLSQWRDPESAKRFIQVDQELWRLKDAEYKEHIKDIIYKEIDIEKGEKAFLMRMTIEQHGQKQNITTFISSRETFFFECTLTENYEDIEVKKLILQIWKIVEAEQKKGAR
jgi:hypothetical protein